MPSFMPPNTVLCNTMNNTHIPIHFSNATCYYAYCWASPLMLKLPQVQNSSLSTSQPITKGNLKLRKKITPIKNLQGNYLFVIVS